MIFKNRIEAGQRLAEKLSAYREAANTLILGLPRGGVPIAAELARQLDLPMDILLVRKLGVPWHEELAMGAISLGDVCVFNEDILKTCHIDESRLSEVLEKEKAELHRRSLRYRGDRPPPDLKDKQVIITDDGIATGATLRAAIKAVRAQNPARIIVASPLAPSSVETDLRGEADEIIVCETPEPFNGIGMWYDEFPQLSDDEVINLLKAFHPPNKGAT